MWTSAILPIVLMPARQNATPAAATSSGPNKPACGGAACGISGKARSSVPADAKKLYSAGAASSQEEKTKRPNLLSGAVNSLAVVEHGQMQGILHYAAR